MFCSKCGKKLDDGWNICPNCGQKLKNRPLDSLANIVEKDDDREVNSRNADQTDSNEGYTNQVYLNPGDACSGFQESASSQGFLYKILSVGFIAFGVLSLFLAEILSGIFFIVSGVLLRQKKMNGQSFGKKGIRIAVAVLLVMFGLLSWVGDEDMEEPMDEPVVEDVQEDVQRDVQEEILGYYPTDVVYGDEWNVQIMFVYVTDSLGSGPQVNCIANICNVSGSDRDFYPDDLFSMENDGIIDEPSSNYDYQTIADGGSFETTLYFIFPENANRDLERMQLRVQGETINLSPKPQNLEEYNSLMGTYESEAGRITMCPMEDNQYMMYYTSDKILFTDGNSAAVTLDYGYSQDGRIAIYHEGEMRYVFLPEEHALSEVSGDGGYYVKTNPCTENVAETDVEDTRNAMAFPEETFDYTGIWLKEPSGQEGQPVYAAGIWIKSISNNLVEYEDIAFQGTPTFVGGNRYEWEAGEPTSHTSDITISDIAGIPCFYYQDTKIYMAENSLFLEQYTPKRRMTLTNFTSYEECVDYYNIDYNYCYNKEGGVTLEKHGINPEVLEDE